MAWRPWTSPFLINLMKEYIKRPLTWVLIIGLVANFTVLILGLGQPTGFDHLLIVVALTGMLAQDYNTFRYRSQANRLMELAQDAVESLARANALTKLVQEMSKRTIDDLLAKNEALEEVINTYQEAGKKPKKKVADGRV